jgi:hypothetical protein
MRIARIKFCTPTLAAFRGGTFAFETGCRSEAQRSVLCEAPFPFRRNQRAAVSSFIHSASSFRLRPYLAWRFRENRDRNPNVYS